MTEHMHVIGFDKQRTAVVYRIVPTTEQIRNQFDDELLARVHFIISRSCTRDHPEPKRTPTWR